MISNPLVIVGAGQAGAELATALRQRGYAGPITLIGEEAHAPYRRPPLSKGYLAGEVDAASLYLKAPAAYAKHGIDLLTGIRVSSIDRDARCVLLEDGRRLPYSRLALTTGGRPRRLEGGSDGHCNVHYIRSFRDVDRLRSEFVAGRRLVVIGGGYIGLEAASIGIKQGLQVTLLEALPRVLPRATGPQVSAYFEAVHRDHGVDLRTGVTARALEGSPRVHTVVLSDGTRVAADLLIVGVGLTPNTELAESAGLAVQNGIIVDQFCRTSDPDIVAAGDCTFHDNGFLQRRVRLESVANAIEQARAAAAALCGKPVPYTAVPWFWSEQFDLKLQMVGLSEGYEEMVIRGSMRAHRFVAFYLRKGTVIAADAINSPQEFMLAKRLVAERTAVTTRRLADEAAPLKAAMVVEG